ncbi:hypothetical protein PVK06_046414 [Gossypium arboreum]|uniref:Uncharacterized protein n=1 Tax=Gossypium arboreum TaxID=29729 RepID=A0ABR0MAJ2_GOSAR|nr:hypothetical protein PVK06_046414 [Gossypium arboreum]
MIAKMKNWKLMTLSVGGKDTLIKAVVSVVPTYLMFCFKFPKKLCGEMNSVDSCFWWGSQQEKGSIHWKNWKNMTSF